jgi:hypothetical protein
MKKSMKVVFKNWFGEAKAEAKKGNDGRGGKFYALLQWAKKTGKGRGRGKGKGSRSTV